MDKDGRRRGSGLQGFALLLFLAGMTLATVWIFQKKVWWFPDPITPLGIAVDRQFGRTLFICGLIFIAAQIVLGIAVWRYRDRGGRSSYSHGNNKLEALWVGASAILFIGLGIAAQRAWASLHFTGAAPGALRVEVTGQQFAWNFRYPGPDGQFGRTDPTLINDGAGNPLGLDDKDPASADDVVSPVITVPVGREVELMLRAKDVTHSFFVRELRLKQDTVPGLVIPVHFTPTKIGAYEVVCAELCGLGHHRMKSSLNVVSEEEFQKWLREQAPEE